MSKYKTTKKEILNNETQIIGFGYCEIQRIERYLNPILYTKTRYGWGCDGYRLKNGWLLTTGYNPISRIMTLPDCVSDHIQRNKELDEQIAKLKADIKDLESRINTLDHEEAKKEVEKYFIVY